MDTEFKLRARRADFSFHPDGIKLYAYQKQGSEKYVAKKLELVHITESGQALEPFLKIDNHEAQQLMDDLWECGLRPSEGTGSAGAMAAIQKHLQDMKTIAFHALKIQK